MHSKIIFARALAAAALLLLVVAGASAQGTLSPNEELGKKLFFDTNLSAPSGLACAGCHGAEVGYTGPDAAINAGGAVYEGAMAGRFGNRKAPSAAYAGDSPILHRDGTTWVGGMFWDGRATGGTLGDPLAEQAQGPFLNPLEQNNYSAQVVIDKVLASNYKQLFLQVCADSNKYYDCIGRAIAAYERSAEVNQFTSKYDYWVKGQAKLTVQEESGRALFMGTAKCVNCHMPPNFTDFTYDNLGVPRNPLNPFYNEPEWNPAGAAWVDTGLGGFLKAAGYSATDYMAEWGKHKVPTLRNVDLRPTRNFVKAYSHNGYFKSLEKIVHFYNTRDVSGAGWPLPEVADNINTAEMGNLGLNHGEELDIVAFLTTLSDGYGRLTRDPELFLPVILDNMVGLGGSHYTTELTLASKATTAIQVDLLYTASVGSGTGSVSLTLVPGETRIIPNTISFLRSQGLAIPTDGGVVGTLLATFVGAGPSGDPFIGGRTYTTGGGGTFGVFYPASATTTTTATLVGLQQNSAQRSNLALVNAGGTSITLRVQLFGPMGEDLGTLPDESLPPYGWTQINRPLEGKAASGRAVVTEVSGPSPFTAYAVLNDAVTSDGSFIPPLIANASGPGDRLVPIVLDVYGLGGTHYTTELTLANLTSSPLPLTFVYEASLGSGSGQATLTLAPGEQQIVPDAIGFLRLQGLAIPNDGSSVGGSLLAVPPSGTAPSSFAVGARTFTPASSGGGTFGLYYPGLTLGESATSVAYINGLQQNAAQRSNVAVVNYGDASDAITLNVSYFDGTGSALGTPTPVTLSPGQWAQFNQPLLALGATWGYAKIEKTSGNSAFAAYGVLNDAVTSDGSYIPMSF